MFYIKLDDNMDLVITVREPIYRGDNLSRKITYLIPFKIGEIDTLTTMIYLSYVRPDGSGDVVALQRLDEKYNESYYQYVLPIDTNISRYPGAVVTWMQILSGSPLNPITVKSGECILQVQESKSIDAYMCDHQVTALYQMQAEMDKKADDLTYNDETRELQLKSGEDNIGKVVIVPSDNYSGGSGDDSEWGDMDDPGTDDDSSGDDYWEDM